MKGHNCFFFFCFTRSGSILHDSSSELIFICRPLCLFMVAFVEKMIEKVLFQGIFLELYL